MGPCVMTQSPFQKQSSGPMPQGQQKEAEHLSVLLVQVLLQAMSQYLSQVVSMHQADTCCKLLDALLLTNQQGVSQPLTNVVADEITHRSESRCSQCRSSASPIQHQMFRFVCFVIHIPSAASNSLWCGHSHAQTSPSDIKCRSLLH